MQRSGAARRTSRSWLKILPACAACVDFRPTHPPSPWGVRGGRGGRRGGRLAHERRVVLHRRRLDAIQHRAQPDDHRTDSRLFQPRTVEARLFARDSPAQRRQFLRFALRASVEQSVERGELHRGVASRREAAAGFAGRGVIAAIDLIAERRPHQPQQCPQFLQSSPRIVDALAVGRSAGIRSKIRDRAFEFFTRDAHEARRQRFVSFEAITHGAILPVPAAETIGKNESVSCARAASRVSLNRES